MYWLREDSSEEALKSEECSLGKHLDELHQFEPGSCTSESELVETSRKLKNTNAKYSRVILDYVMYLRSIGLQSKATDLINVSNQ